MGELPRFKEVHKVVLPFLNKEVYEHAEVTEGEEVVNLRLEEQGTHFVNTSKTPPRKIEIAFDRGLGCFVPSVVPVD